MSKNKGGKYSWSNSSKQNNNVPNIPVASSTKDEFEDIVETKEETPVEETPVEETINKTKDIEEVVEETKEVESGDTVAVTVDKVDIRLSHKMDEKIKALRNIEFNSKDFGVEMWLPTEELMIDEETQRGLMVSQVEKIINEFNPSSFGRITVSKRKDGYYVTNGQHRLIALRKIGIDKAPCIVIDNPYENEKEIKKFDAINFLEINQNSQAVRAIDKYRIGVSAQLQDWINVKQVIEENGLRAGTTRNSVNALACIYRYINSSKNPKTVNRKKSQMSKAIKILKETVGVPEITHVSLQAMCIIVREYVDTKITTVDKIITRFNKIELQKLLSTAIKMKNDGIQKNVVTGLAQMLVQEYNNKCRRQEDKLPVDRLFMTDKREHMMEKMDDLEV